MRTDQEPAGQRARRPRLTALRTALAMAGVLAIVGAALVGAHLAGAGGSEADAPRGPAEPAGGAVGSVDLAERVVAEGQPPQDVGSNGVGELLTLHITWLDSQKRSPYAWLLQDASRASGDPLRHTGLLTSDEAGRGPRVFPTGDGYLLKAVDTTGVLVDRDGTTTPVRQGPKQTVRPGTVAVCCDDGIELLNPRSAVLWSLHNPPGRKGETPVAVHVDAAGTVWVLSGSPQHDRVIVSWLSDSGWKRHGVVSPAIDWQRPLQLAVSSRQGRPTKVAALSDPGGEGDRVPVGVLATSADGGVTWHELTRDRVPFRIVRGMAADASGTLYVVDYPGRVWRSTDDAWTAFERADLVGTFRDLRPAGDAVVALGLSKHGDPRFVFLDRGAQQGADVVLRRDN